MFPYYYPTTIALIDDDIHFAQGLQTALQPPFIVRTYNRAQDALDCLIGEHTANISRIGRLGGYATSQGWPANELDRLQLLFASYIGQLRGHPKRFETVSVVVVDHEMAGVDGITICRALRRRPVRKILLTESGGEKLILQAFNEGIIDRYVSRRDPNLQAVLTEHIRELQRAYFRRTTTSIKDALLLKLHGFMTEATFLQHFKELCAEREIVEYYVRAQPTGVELIRSDGRTWVLLVLGEEEIRNRISAARTAGADEELLNAMESGAVIAQFPSEGGYYEPRFRDSWRLYAFPATEISGASRWLTAVVQPTAVRPMGLRGFVPLNEFFSSQSICA